MPWVTVSPFVPKRGWTPLSTLMPGMMPSFLSSSTMGVPHVAVSKSVSS